MAWNRTHHRVKQRSSTIEERALKKPFPVQHQRTKFQFILIDLLMIEMLHKCNDKNFILPISLSIFPLYIYIYLCIYIHISIWIGANKLGNKIGLSALNIPQLIFCPLKCHSISLRLIPRPIRVSIFAMHYIF